MKLRLMSISLLRGLHTVILLFVLFGWLLPPAGLVFHLCFVPLMVLQWYLNDDVCILTQIEEKLRPSDPVSESDANAPQGEFIKSLFERHIGYVPSDRFLKLLIYGCLWMAWILSAFHLSFVYYRS